MSERTETFQVEGIPTVRARVPTGSLSIVAGRPGEVAVRLRGSSSTLAKYLVEQSGDLIEIRPESGGRIGLSSVEIAVESGTAPVVEARLSSGDLSAVVEVASLRAETASGEVRADRVAGDVSIRSASGDVRIGSVDGSLKIAIASGDVTAGAVLGGTDVKSASGDLRVKIAATGVKAKTASGDITVGTLRSGDLDATCISGDVTVGIPEGRTVDVRLDSLTGRVSTEFPVRHDAEVDAPDDGDVSTIKIRAMSGDINLRPAETA